MLITDRVLQSLLADDIEAQRTRDAARTYEIERALRVTMPPVARLELQAERASLMVAS